MSSSVDSAVEVDAADIRKPVKRRRVNLTCRNCKRRKTKCDKTLPCSPCLTRGEGSDCTYEEGVIPPAQSLPVSREDIVSLKSRLARVEALLNLRNEEVKLPALKSPVIASNVRSAHAGLEERAFHALEGFADPADVRSIGNSMFPPRGGPVDSGGGWPTILSSSNAQATKRWTRDMYEVLDAIPSPAHLQVLVDYFFYEVQSMRYYLNETVFRAEIEQFELVRSTTTRIAVDPGWLAILTGVIWVVCNFVFDEDSLPPAFVESGIDTKWITDLAEVMFDSLQTALTCSSWLVRPCFRIVQALLVVIALNQQYAYNPIRLLGPRVESSRVLWFDMAVGICKGLRLQRVVSIGDLADMKDPTLPLDRPLYTVETVHRVFSHVLLLDTFNLSTSPGSNFFPANSYVTPEPHNYSETALSAEDKNDISQPWERTSYVWELHITTIAKIWREILQVFAKEERPSYSVILHLDSELRQSHQHLCTLQALHDLDERDSLTFKFVNSSYQQRFLRLHRSYLLRSYEDTQFFQSQRIVLDAARQISKTHRLLLKEYSHKLGVRYALYLFVHHITALTVFFIHALHQPDQREEMRRELSQSCEIFLKLSLEGHAAFVRGSSKAYSVTVELLSVLGDNPDPPQDLVELLHGLKTKAATSEAILMQRDLSYVNGQGSASHPLAIDRSGLVVQPEMTVEPESNQAFNWDIDWISLT